VQTLLFIALGGALGALARYGVSTGVHSLAGRAFPYGTLTANILGSLLMGFLYILLIDRMSVDGHWRALFLVGGLGAFTTFSTFSLETINLLEGGEPAKAAINIILSVVACLIAAWLGILAGRQL
jgi:CrcB protein